MRFLFAGLALVGAIIPLAAFIPWLADNGMAPRLFISAMFANPVATFFSLDVLISAIVVVLFCIAEARAGRLAYPVPPIPGNLSDRRVLRITVAARPASG